MGPEVGKRRPAEAPDHRAAPLAQSQWHTLRHRGCRVREHVRGPLGVQISDGPSLAPVAVRWLASVCVLDKIAAGRQWQRLNTLAIGHAAKLIWHVFRNAFAGPTNRFANSLLAAPNVETSTFTSRSTAAT